MRLRSSLLSLKIFPSCLSHKSLFLSCLFLVILTQTTFSLRLENDGAYHVVVAIDRKTAKNNIEDYIDNMKLGLKTLSNYLYSSTKNKFFIKSVDIVLPEHWNFPEDEIASANYFENADIRISHEFQEPYVYNPKLCGSSGEYIQLPYDFFNTRDDVDGRYGRVGSALLKQWATYRYGVWEEHGYPLDSSFLYFFQTPQEPEWNVNYCSDIHLDGEIKTLNKEECNREDPSVNPPGYDCRFFPTENQTPTSSIMSFHFMNSIHNFCDKENHNRFSPNRQNIYCGYRSAQEVIEASSDWKSVTQENSAPPETVFTVMKMTKKPLLYLVLDGGLTQAPGFVIEEIKENLKTLVNGSIDLPTGVIANVGSFSAEAESNGKSLTEELPWSDIVKHKEDIEKAIDASFSKTSGFRDFASAIKEALDNIKHRQHEFGSVMVIVKTGEATNFEKIYYEDEIITYIKELGIKVYAFEVKGNVMKPSLNLINLASETKGKHYIISGKADLEEMLLGLEDIAEDLKEFKFVPEKKFRTIYKGVVEPDTEIILSVAEISKLNFHLIPINNGIISSPKIEQVEEMIPPGSKASVTLQNKIDWHTNSLVGSGMTRKTYKGAFTYTVSQPEAEYWKITYDCSSDECSSYLFIYGESPTEADVKSDEIQVFVTTSALNGEVDLREGLQFEAINKFNTPFGIYAKLQHQGFPIKNVGDIFSVKAIISLRDSLKYWTVDLVDNGLRTPDITSNDGIFSGSFVPDANGVFKISVQVTFLAVRDSDDPEDTTTVGTTDSGEGASVLKNSARLVAVEQGLIGCGSDFSGCWATILPFDFMKVVDYTQTVKFVNVASYIPFPQKILDLRASHLDNYEIELQWTHPGVIEASGTVNRVSEYELVYKENFEELVDDFNSGVPEVVGCVSDADPGTKCSFTIRMKEGATYFYAVRSLHHTEYRDNIISPASNCIGIEAKEMAPVTIPPSLPPTTTTTTSTTTTTTTTSTTTEAPTTSESTTSEVPTKSTTTRGTTVSTISTTRPPRTTSGSTIPMSTSTEAPIKHWYKEKEAIITLSVFGGLVILLIFCGFAFMKWKRYRSDINARQRLINNSRQGSDFEYQL